VTKKKEGIRGDRQEPPQSQRGLMEKKKREEAFRAARSARMQRGGVKAHIKKTTKRRRKHAPWGGTYSQGEYIESKKFVGEKRKKSKSQKDYKERRGEHPEGKITNSIFHTRNLARTGGGGVVVPYQVGSRTGGLNRTWE